MEKINEYDNPAFPVVDPNDGQVWGGLTKREYFAALNNAAMLGAFMSCDSELRLKQVKSWVDKYGGDIVISDAMALDSIKSADSLILGLNTK